MNRVLYACLNDSSGLDNYIIRVYNNHDITLRSYIMIRKILCMMFFVSLGLLLAQPADLFVNRLEDLDFAWEDYPEIDGVDNLSMPNAFVPDPYADVPTYYITAGGQPGPRYLVKVTIPSLDEPEMELLRTFPLYIGDEPYEEWDYDIYVYVPGLTVSEDYIFVGLYTYLEYLDEDEDEPEIESGVNGFYIMKFAKDDGSLVDLRRNQNSQHRVRGLHYMQIDDPVTLYVDEEGDWVDGPGEGIDEYIVDDALLATQWGGRGIFALDPHNLEYVPGGTGFERNFRPRTYTVPPRGRCSDLIYDVEAGDLYLLAFTAGEWEEIEYDGPGFVRQQGYNPFDPDGAGEGEQIAELLAPEEEIDNWQYWDPEQEWFQGNPVWSGMDMYVSPEGHKFFTMADFWNGFLYLYEVIPQPDDSVETHRHFVSDRPTFWNKPVDVVFHEEEDGLYMIALNYHQRLFEVWEVGFAPTFSSSWSLFQ